MRQTITLPDHSYKVAGPRDNPTGGYKVFCPHLSRTLDLIVSDGSVWKKGIVVPDLANLPRGLPKDKVEAIRERWKGYSTGDRLPLPAWEHVSVSAATTPTWAEMCFIKAIFWEPEDTVIQLHPPESLYVSDHDNCLHLWKPVGVDIPLPPRVCV